MSRGGEDAGQRVSLPLPPSDLRERLVAATAGELGIAPLVVGMEIARARRLECQVTLTAWRKAARAVRAERKRRDAAGLGGRDG